LWFGVGSRVVRGKGAQQVPVRLRSGQALHFGWDDKGGAVVALGIGYWDGRNSNRGAFRPRFQPMYAEANMGHPPRLFGRCLKADGSG